MGGTDATQAGPRRYIGLIAGLAALAALAMVLPLQNIQIARHYFVPIHTLLEFLTILVAFLVFATAWHAPEKEISASLLVIAAAIFIAGCLDFVHTLAIKDLPESLMRSANIAEKQGVAFRLVARLIVAATLLGVGLAQRLLAPSRVGGHAILALYVLMNAALMWGVLAYETRAYGPAAEPPSAFNPFAFAFEWLTPALFALAAWQCYRRARLSGDEFWTSLFLASAIAALSEILLSNHEIVNDVQSLLGHLYKFVGYIFIYQAMAVSSIRKPYQRLAAQTRTLQRINETLRTQSLALESVATPALVTDLQGKVSWRNRASRTIWSSRFDERLFLFAEPMTPDPVIASDIRATVQEGRVWRGLVHARDEHGEDIVLDRIVTPLRNEADVIEGYVVVSQNVTANLKAQLRHQRVLETALDGFWIADIDGHLLEANEAYARMSGYAIPELLTMRISELEATQTPEQVRSHARYLVQHGHDQFETRHRHKLGHDFPVEVSVTYDPESRQLYVFSRDRSEREHAAMIKQDLERQLQRSQRLQELGQLTGGIAHDFNNILAAILGYSNLALERLVPDKQGKLAAYLREVIAASERARDLIAKLLLFTRMQPSANVGLISPATVIDDVVAMMRPSIPASIELRSRIDDPLQIRMDPVELNQVLVNLIINARDAIDGGGQGMIDIHLHRVEVEGLLCTASQQRLSGAYVVIEVSDTGSGIAPEHMQRLFTPFFTTKDVGKGTGLGLSMVQGILRRAGAYVVVQSQPGRGSCFQLLFRVATPQEDSATGAPAGEPRIQAGAGQHVWVLDDETALTLYLSDLLEGQGYRVRQFNDPGELLRAFEAATDPVDLLITDQTMPGMNGAALAQRLRAIRPDFPVILCTGHDASVDRADLLRGGIRHCFIKPVSAAELMQAVMQVLNR